MPSDASAIATLTGTATDADGHSLTHLWTRVSGPGNVVFGDDTSLTTTATFSAPGVYILRLTSHDGFGESFDEVTIEVGDSTTFTVTYDGNDNTTGEPPLDPQNPYSTGSSVTVLGNTGGLTKTGAEFIGWNTAADGTGTSYAPAATFTIHADITLYANWNHHPIVDAGSDQQLQLPPPGAMDPRRTHHGSMV